MSEVTDDQLVSQVFRNCADVYDLMRKESKELQAEAGAPPMHVWEGFFTKLITDRMGFSVPYYSSIRSNLMRMGCIRQLRRGGGSSPSQWQLLREPTEQLWYDAPQRKSPNASKQEETLHQLADLIRRIERLEENFDVLAKAIVRPDGKLTYDEPEHKSQYRRHYEDVSDTG